MTTKMASQNGNVVHYCLEILVILITGIWSYRKFIRFKKLLKAKSANILRAMKQNHTAKTDGFIMHMGTQHTNRSVAKYGPNQKLPISANQEKILCGLC